MSVCMCINTHTCGETEAKHSHKHRGTGFWRQSSLTLLPQETSSSCLESFCTIYKIKSREVAHWGVARIFRSNTDKVLSMVPYHNQITLITKKKKKCS